ncbi:MAG: hypothetical protein KDB61_05485 [Planctomycetes bacterium]|nr:hypothetical protein [Planctomycetota bacterium]
MIDYVIHGLLFLFVGSVIVAVSCMFADAEDGQALKAFPKRWLTFMGGCAVVVLLMLLFEHTLASVH